jgi:hypothetical protein
MALTSAEFSVVFRSCRLGQLSVPLTAISPHHLLEKVDENRVAFTKAVLRAGGVAEPPMCVVSTKDLPVEFYNPASPEDSEFEWIILNGAHILHASLQIIREDSEGVNSPPTSAITSQNALSYITVEVYDQGEFMPHFTKLLH